MIDLFGDSQKKILEYLHQNKTGLPIEALATHLAVSRTAIVQHLAALEKDGLVESPTSESSGGRPRKLYRLTMKGFDLFPKRYVWFSNMLLGFIKTRKGNEGLSETLEEVAKAIHEAIRDRLDGKTPHERMAETLKIMNEFSYKAKMELDAEGQLEIVAHNCVYYHLAKDHPEMCDFDLKFLSMLFGSTIRQRECMLTGGEVCRFRRAEALPPID